MIAFFKVLLGIAGLGALVGGVLLFMNAETPLAQGYAIATAVAALLGVMAGFALMRFTTAWKKSKNT